MSEEREIDDSGSAFPIVDHISAEDRSVDYGLTKREWFAGKALQGMLASSNGFQLIPPDMAKRAYVFADEMIAKAEGTK